MVLERNGYILEQQEFYLKCFPEEGEVKNDTQNCQ